MQQMLSGAVGRRWRQTDAAMDVESLGDVSVSSSIERQAMREQLDAVRQTLNSLANTTQANAAGVNAAQGGVEGVLSDIATKLANIEGLYTSLTTKLEKVDLRVEDSERHIKDLQHFSASTIHETARLVDFVGNNRGTPGARTGSQAGVGPSGASAGAALRARNLAASGVPTTPPPPGVSPSRSSVQAIDFVSGHLTSTIQQHAAQIHKLIAGLDFLEAHIIRQDQVVDGLQKQLLTVARDVAATSAVAESRTSPSELSLRVHDMNELLNKLRTHMYKVEKKTSSNDQALAQLTERIQAAELAGGRQGQQQRGEAGEATSSERDTLQGPSLMELAAAQEDVRSMVQDLCRDVLELRDQVQVQATAQALQPATSVAAPGVSAEEGAEMRRQLSYLMSQVPTLLVENKELKDLNTAAQKRIDDLAAALDQRQLQQQQSAPPPAESSDAGCTAAGDAAASMELQGKVASLQEQVVALEGRLAEAAPRAEVVALSSAVQAVEDKAAAALQADAELDAGLAAVRESVAAVQERVAGLQAGLAEQQDEAVAMRTEVAFLGSAVLSAAAEQQHSFRAGPASPAADAVAKVARSASGTPPDAAVFAAQVAAAAKADLEEQFGQLRHKVEAATAAAAAAEEAARNSAESAAAASAALEAASKPDDSVVAAAASSALAVVAAVEQEQAVLKQQLAQLAAHVSEEQAAISAGLLQVQEQVAAAAIAATEAAAAAQAVQEQQAAAGQQEQQAAELRTMVASVMEQLKERVEQGMLQVDAQLSAFSDRLGTAVTTAQLEAALREGLTDTVTQEALEASLKALRAAAEDAAERHDLDAASLEELRAELILLTGQQDVTQSRLQGLENLLGVDARSSPLGRRRTTSSSIPPTIEEGEAEGEDADEEAEAEAVDRDDDGAEEAEQGEDDGPRARATPLVRASGLGMFAAVGSCGSRGLLDLVAELQSRVGGLEGALEAAAADMDQLRYYMQSNGERTQQATAKLISDLQGLSAAVDERAASAAADLLALESASASMQQKVADQAGVTSELAARMAEVQLRLESEIIARVQETSAAVSQLSARIMEDYINREQLGAIFKARSDMKRAMDELSTVFSTGRLLRTASSDQDDAAGSAEPGSVSTPSLSPRLVSALDDLARKQEGLEQQVKLALFRTDAAVRQEQLAGLQQAMMTLELQFRRLTGTAAPAFAATQHATAAPALVEASPANLADLRARVEALEAALGTVAPTTSAWMATPRASGVAPSDADSSVRVLLTPEDFTDGSTPIRLRLLVAESSPHPFAESSVMAAPLLGADADVPLRRGPEEEVGEPSLSSMLHGGGNSSSPTITAILEAEAAASASADDDQLQVQEFRRALAGLTSQAEVMRSELAVESAERQRLAEALAELTERVDLQVNATASTAAMIATMATDSPAQRVALQVRVGATEAEADLAVLAATVSTLAARLDAAEESLASAFVVRTPRSPTRAAAAAAATAAAAPEVPQPEGSADGAIPQPDDTQAAEAAASTAGSSEAEDNSSEEAALRPALGLMVPVLPREVEQQIAALQAEAARLEASLGALAGRVDGLEAADALEDVRAVASEAVLDAIPGMVSQQVAVVRQEIEAMVGRQGTQLLEMVGQAARDATEAVLAVREAAAEAAAARDAVAEALAEREAAARAAAEVAEAAATEAAAQAAAAREAAVEAEEAAAAAAATASAREAALEVAMSVAREAAEEAVREAAARASDTAADALATPHDEELAGRVSRLAVEVKDVRGAVGSLTERMSDVDALRDQLEALAAQVRDSITASAAGNEADPAATNNASAQGPPSTPTAAAAVAGIFTPAATAIVIPPARTPHGASPSTGGSRQASATATGSQQAAFLARLVAVVKRQSSRLHAQYSDAEETDMALAQVDSTLEEAEARLADVRDTNSPAFAETLVTVLEQVAALRYIGSQTHPAVQQMVLEHENRLDKIAEELKALGAGSPSRTSPAGAAALAAAATPPALLEEVGLMSRQVAHLETELTRVAGQQAALDRAVKDMLAAVGSVRLGSVSGSSITTGSRRTSAHDGYAMEAPAAAASVYAVEPAATADVAAAMEADVAAADDVAAAAGAAPSALEVAGLAAQVQLLEDTLEVQLGGLRQELMAEIRARAGSGGGAASVAAAGTAADLRALERTVSQLHSALTAIRNRLLAMQEYVDSTQGMIKDMHVGLGGLHRRVDALEATSGPGSHSARVSSSGTAEPASVRELQADLVKFERRLLGVESSSLEAVHALAGLKGLAPRVTEAETRLQDACCKLAVALGGSTSSSSSATAPVIPAVAPGGSLPAVAGAVRALERRLGGRVEAACGALDTLAGALSAAGRIQAESTANPFKAISAAVNNPVMVAMEKRLEAVRTEILGAVTSLSEDMRRDTQQLQLESRLASADTSVRAGSDYGGPPLTFRALAAS